MKVITRMFPMGGSCYRKVIAILILLLFPLMSLWGQVNTEKLRRKKNKDYFEIRLGFSLALYKGNTDLFSMDTDLRLDYKRGKNEAFLLGNITYGEKQDESFLNKGFVHLRGIRNISSMFYVEAYFQEEFNHFLRLKDRTLIGGGIRLGLIKYRKDNKQFDLYTGIGLMYEGERFNTSDLEPEKEDTSMLKSTSYLSLEYKTERFRLSDVTYFQFHVGKGDSTRIYSDFIFSVKLSKVLSYRATMNYRYDSVPAPGVKNYDLQVKNGLTITFN